jgi:hypothetical protein
MLTAPAVAAPAQDEPAAKEASNPTPVWVHRQEVVQTMRMRIATIATVVAALAVPVAAQGSPTAIVPEHHPAYEKHYLELRKQVVKQVGLNAAGRNIVSDGYLEHSGDVHQATKAEIVDSSNRLEASLNPPAPAPTSTTEAATTGAAAATASSSSSTSSASSSTIQCESGGNYSADTGNGYYGAYQFDQSTWDAYAPSGYAGTNPAAAPPAVQDQTAASVPYDAWPNC